jgi:hAT family protein
MVCSSKSNNIFDNMATLTAPKTMDLHDELDHYLSSDPEHVVDAVCWWHDRHTEYPCLLRIAINYLIIPYK